MAKRLKHEKKYRKDQTQQIGDHDDAPTRVWRIKKEVRERLQNQRPDLSSQEIEKRVNRIVARGFKRAA